MNQGTLQPDLQEFAQQTLDTLEVAAPILLQRRLHQLVQDWSPLSKQRMMLPAHQPLAQRLLPSGHHRGRQQHALRRRSANAKEKVTAVRRRLADLWSAARPCHKEGQQSAPWCLSWQAADAGTQLKKLRGCAAGAGEHQQQVALWSSWEKEAVGR